MGSYATVDELQARWRPLDAQEAAKAAVLLEDASAMLVAECAKAGRACDERLLKIVCADMVIRAMQASALNGIQSMQQGAGSYQMSITPFNPGESLYLSKSNRRLLGISAQRMGAIHPAARTGSGHMAAAAINAADGASVAQGGGNDGS
jgi:hypothetical protein